LGQSPSCSNDFECAAQVKALAAYQKRCTKKGVPIPVEDALVQGKLLLEAGQPVAPLAVLDERVAPQKERLLLDSGAGYVVRAGEHRPKNISELSRLIESAESQTKLTVAGVFPAKHTALELRFGTLYAPDLSSISRRYPMLLLDGQLEAERLAAANQSIASLNEAAKQLKSYQVAMPLIIKTLIAAPAGDAELALELGKADKHLARLFARIARDKNDLGKTLSNAAQKAAMARRAQMHPFWDVDAEGVVKLGEASRAVYSAVKELFPKSHSAYQETLSARLKHLAEEALSEAGEQTLRQLTRRQIESCRTARDAVIEMQSTLMDCAFGYQACAPELIDQKAEALDAAYVRLRERRLELGSALAGLSSPPEDVRSQAGDCLASQH
jgi:hypothetical protein